MFKRFKKKPDVTAEPTDLDRAVNKLYVAEGTQSRESFLTLTLPVLKSIQGDLARGFPGEADSETVALCESIAAACRRARVRQLPMNRPGTDYRKYETSYGYALVTAMCVSWYLKKFQIPTGKYFETAEKLIPRLGLENLQHHEMVWSDWKAFFTGELDGGLREVANEPPAPMPAPMYVGADGTDVPSGEREVGGPAAIPSKPNEQLPAAAIVGDNPQKAERPRGMPMSLGKEQWAPPHIIGWEVVEAFRQGIVEGKIKPNKKDSFLVVDADGRTFLRSPEAFEWCARELGGDAGAKMLENRFCELNTHMRTRDPRPHRTEAYAKYKGRWRKHPSVIRGYVIEHESVLWAKNAPRAAFYIIGVTSVLPKP